MSKSEERKQAINESYRTLRDFNEEIQGLDRAVGKSNEHAESREQIARLLKLNVK